MTLKRLVLHNYMIHRDLEADFSGNLIALTGEMGHGKSTFVGAIQFCLTGEHPPWHRDDLVTWGEDEGSAKLYFSQDGIDCSILRKLHSSEVILSIGNENFSGARNVEKALTERLGVDKDILKQIGFVQQYEIQSILFDDPGKRERSFQKLLGIGDANKIWTDLGPIIQGYSRSENFDASIEALKVALAGLEKDLQTVDQNLETSKKALSLVPSHDTLNDDLVRMTALQSHIRYLSETRKRISDLSESALKSERDRVLLLAERQKIMESVNPLKDMEQYVANLKEAHDTHEAALKNMRKLTGASDIGGECPLCGSKVTENQISEHMSSELKKLEETEAKSRSDYLSMLNSYTTIKAGVDQIESRLRDLDSNCIRVTGLLDAEKQRERDLMIGFAKFGISPEDSVDDLKSKLSDEIQRANITLAQLSELNKQIAMLTGERYAKQQQLDKTKQMIDEKVKEKELSAPIAHKVDVLSNVRTWFHSSNGPRTMSLSAIRSMTGYINEYLNCLHSEISVVPDNQGLSFAFTYLDGRPVSNPPPSTAKLSGGQKIELALAFRLAIYRYFGQKMGIMVLDEPTAHLSPAGIEYFGTLLQTVSTLARNMNLQIIMPTHEKEIMPYMDSEIHFS